MTLKITNDEVLFYYWFLACGWSCFYAIVQLYQKKKMDLTQMVVWSWRMCIIFKSILHDTYLKAYVARHQLQCGYSCEAWSPIHGTLHVSVTAALVLQHREYFGLTCGRSAQNPHTKLGRVFFMGITNKIIWRVI